MRSVKLQHLKWQLVLKEELKSLLSLFFFRNHIDKSQLRPLDRKKNEIINSLQSCELWGSGSVPDWVDTFIRHDPSLCHWLCKGCLKSNDWQAVTWIKSLMSTALLHSMEDSYVLPENMQLVLAWQVCLDV